MPDPNNQQTREIGQVLVTGATGFTGSHLCRRLAELGHPTRALVRDPSRAGFLTDLGIEVVEGDVCDQSSVAAATRGVDTVMHIAALFRDVTTDNKYWEVNLEGTRHLLDESINAGVGRFVHCSTIGVHGDVKKLIADEQAPFNPGDIYQETKLAGEKLAREYSSQGRLEVVVCRPAGIYGPGDLRFRKLVSAVKKQRFVMVGSGEARFHMVYIDDLIDGFLLAATRATAANNVYIIAGGEIVTTNELVALVGELLGVKRTGIRVPYAPVYAAAAVMETVCKPLGISPPLYRRRVHFFVNNRAFNISKARTELDYQPKVDLRTGLQRTIAWYEENSYL